MKGSKIVSLVVIILLVSVGLILGGMKSYQYYKKTELERERIAVYEKLILDQKQTIEELGKKIEQLERSVKASRQQRAREKQAELSRYESIAEGLLKKHKEMYKDPNIFLAKVNVDGEVMKCFFTSDVTAEAWLQTKPSFFARQDLAYFLKAAGREKGTVEYYTPAKRKVFSISGNLDSVKTKKY